MNDSIYGGQKEILPKVMDRMVAEIEDYNRQKIEETGHPVYEHLSSRIKAEDSMREKCRRKGVDETPEEALRGMKDAIGIRIITGFIDDIYEICGFFRQLQGCRVVQEKDYIYNAKPNGYRSYHMILETSQPYEDITGQNPGSYYVEIQLRTIAMDCWASLEHEMKYKRSISNQKMLVGELKRCADELASCDLTMQTIRDLIRSDE